MLRIEAERDIERLREVARLLDAENARLHARLAELTTALAAARGNEPTRALQLELLRLQEQLTAQTRALFGRSSEQRRTPRTDPTGARSPARGHGPRTQPSLPLVEIVHTLDPADEQCPAGQLPVPGQPCLYASRLTDTVRHTNAEWHRDTKQHRHTDSERYQHADGDRHSPTNRKPNGDGNRDAHAGHPANREPDAHGLADRYAHTQCDPALLWRL